MNSEQPADAEQAPAPPTPTPGISRARSLPLDLPAVPVRRPTELDENIGNIAEELRPSSPEIDPAGAYELILCRVTYLSLLSADTFAWCASNIATSLLMLPLDLYCTRLLTRSFLSAATGSSTNARGSMMLHDVWPLSPWLSFREMGIGGSLKFVSRVFLTFGIQSVLSTVLWRGMAFWAQWQGHRRYGWGRF